MSLFQSWPNIKYSYLTSVFFNVARKEAFWVTNDIIKRSHKKQTTVLMFHINNSILQNNEIFTY